MQVHGVLSHLLGKLCLVEEQNQQIINLVVEAEKVKEATDLDQGEQKNSFGTACFTETKITTLTSGFELEETELYVEEIIFC